MFAKTVERMKKERKDKEREKLTRQLKLSKLYRQNVFNDLKRTDVFIAETEQKLAVNEKSGIIRVRITVLF